MTIRNHKLCFLNNSCNILTLVPNIKTPFKTSFIVPCYVAVHVVQYSDIVQILPMNRPVVTPYTQNRSVHN